MSLDYVKDSLKRKNSSRIEFMLINHIASGSGFIDVKILVDDKEVTESAMMKIGEQEATEVKPMYVTSNYGDLASVIIKPKETLKHGYHKIKINCNVENLGSYSVEFGGTA
jgi:hypothetical protein